MKKRTNETPEERDRRRQRIRDNFAITYDGQGRPIARDAQRLMPERRTDIAGG